MPVHQTGFSGQAVVPCSHCNTNDEGSEAGICHRHLLKDVLKDGRACYECTKAANAGTLPGVIARTLLASVGGLQQIPCCYCDGKGYRRV